ncbi:MAG: AI-2E family transporter [Burkholderiaceae bacterium]
MSGEDPAPSRSANGLTRGVYARAGGLAVFALLLLVSWQILAPFMVSLAWAISLAVSVHPIQTWLARRLGRRPRSAAALVSLLLIVTVLLPVGMLLIYATQAVQAMATRLGDLKLLEMAPPAVLDQIPLLGEHLQSLWRDAQQGDFATFSQIEAAVGGAAGWLVHAGLAISGSFAQVLIAMVLVFPMLLGAERSVHFARKLADAVEPTRGQMLLDVATRVVRGVSLGVIGGAAVATAALLVGLGIAGAPALGLIGVLSFLVALVQAPIFLIGLAVAGWLWWQGAVAWAVFAALWSVGVHLAYTVLQPMLISKEAGLPISVMFLGVLGGFIAFGFIGLFVGPVVLGTVYAMVVAWVEAADA